MNKRLLKTLLTASASVALSLFMLKAHTASENPHVISKATAGTDCSSCHSNSPQLTDSEILETKNLSMDPTQFHQDGVAMCSSCHNPNEGHKVGLEIDFPVPADMPLSAENDITCLTCHYTHGSLSSDRPQASFSFMDRLMNAERLQKSFLLRRNNSDGELCLTCHNANQGSQ